MTVSEESGSHDDTSNGQDEKKATGITNRTHCVEDIKEIPLHDSSARGHGSALHDNQNVSVRLVCRAFR